MNHEGGDVGFSAASCIDELSPGSGLGFRVSEQADRNADGDFGWVEDILQHLGSPKCCTS